MRYHCLENKDTDKTENKDSDSPETISKQIHGIFSPEKLKRFIFTTRMNKLKCILQIKNLENIF